MAHEPLDPGTIDMQISITLASLKLTELLEANNIKKDAATVMGLLRLSVTCLIQTDMSEEMFLRVAKAEWGIAKLGQTRMKEDRSKAKEEAKPPERQ